MQLHEVDFSYLHGTVSETGALEALETEPIAPRFDSLDDSSLAKWLANDRLRDRIAYNGAFEWLYFNGKRWKRVARHEIVELVRQEHDAAVAYACMTSRDGDEIKRLVSLLGTSKSRTSSNC